MIKLILSLAIIVSISEVSNAQIPHCLAGQLTNRNALRFSLNANPEWEIHSDDFVRKNFLDSLFIKRSCFNFKTKRNGKIKDTVLFTQTVFSEDFLQAERCFYSPEGIPFNITKYNIFYSDSGYVINQYDRGFKLRSEEFNLVSEKYFDENHLLIKYNEVAFEENESGIVEKVLYSWRYVYEKSSKEFISEIIFQKVNLSNNSIMEKRNISLVSFKEGIDLYVGGNILEHIITADANSFSIKIKEVNGIIEHQTFTYNNEGDIEEWDIKLRDEERGRRKDQTVEFFYDKHGNMTREVTRFMDGVKISCFYTFDLNGLLLKEKSPNANFGVMYLYE